MRSNLLLRRPIARITAGLAAAALLGACGPATSGTTGQPPVPPASSTLPTERPTEVPSGPGPAPQAGALGEALAALHGLEDRLAAFSTGLAVCAERDTIVLQDAYGEVITVVEGIRSTPVG